MCYNVFVTSARFFRAFPAMAPRQAVLLTPSISLRSFRGVPAHKSRTKLLKSSSLFSRACALFHFPYPVSPVFATLTRTAGVYTNNSHSGTHNYFDRGATRFVRSAQSRSLGLIAFLSRHSALATRLKSFIFISFRTLLHSRKDQLFSFHALPVSLAKTPGGGRRSIRRLTRNIRKGQEIAPDWAAGFPDPFPWQRIRRRGAACEAS